MSADYPILVTPEWVDGNASFLEESTSRLVIDVKDEKTRSIPSLQLSELKGREEKLRRILHARCSKEIPSIKADWKRLITLAIESSGQKINPQNKRHMNALAEQALALEQVTSRRLSALVGSAGTGKTSVVGGIVNCEALQKEGILLLAPTGKARVRLQGATGGDAMTVAEFLYQQDRYDGSRQRPLFESKKTFNKAKTVIVDEASMLTLDDFLAILLALDLTHVQRVILVGDPSQLPPIGTGRPFADLVSWLPEMECSEKTEDQRVGGGHWPG